MRLRDVNRLAEIMDQLRPPNPPLSQPTAAWQNARLQIIDSVIPANRVAHFEARCPHEPRPTRK